MAGDWIKMRVDLHTHPKVVRIVSAVCPQDVRKVSSRCLVVGALHAMWSLFDAHSIDGELRGYGPETLDALVGLDGFAAGVAAVEWLVITPNSLAMPNFGTHNGKGAKRRAEDTAAKRVRRMSEECPQDDRTDCGPEKRREEKIVNTPPSPQGDRVGESSTDPPKPTKRVKLLPDYTTEFVEFYKSYPSIRRQKKQVCWAIWQRDIEKHQEKDRAAAAVMEGLRRWCKCHQWNKDGGQFVCGSEVFLRQRRYMEDPPTAPRSEHE
jgi:hypothetical protein